MDGCRRRQMGALLRHETKVQPHTQKQKQACKTSRVNISLCVFYILAIMPAFTHILTNTKVSLTLSRSHTHEHAPSRTHTHFSSSSDTLKVRACVKWGRGEDDEYTQKIKLGRAIKVAALTA